MNKLNELLQELGLSKVKLAKYLGVSRQMVYNYLVLDSLDKWPKEKKVLLLQLLDIKDASDETLENIVVDTEYLMGVEKRLNSALKSSNSIDSFIDLNGLTKENKALLNSFIFLIKEKLEEDPSGSSIKYILGYIAKSNGFISPDEYAFNEEKQFIFEGILFTALTLYNNGRASKSRIIAMHKKFINEIERKNEKKLGRTQQLNTCKIQALRELGYSDITPENAAEILEKMAEIETREV